MWVLNLFVENVVLVSRFVAEMMADDEGVLGLVAGGYPVRYNRFVIPLYLEWDHELPGHYGGVCAERDEGLDEESGVLVLRSTVKARRGTMEGCRCSGRPCCCYRSLPRLGASRGCCCRRQDIYKTYTSNIIKTLFISPVLPV